MIGVGSELRGDDAAGVLIVRRLLEDPRIINCPHLLCIEGATAPENLTGQIRGFDPQLVVFFDAAGMRDEVGQVRLIEENEMSGPTFSSHMMPLSIVIGYLKQSINAEFVAVGIQPQDVSFGNEPCREVLMAVDRIVEGIKESLDIC